MGYLFGNRGLILREEDGEQLLRVEVILWIVIGYMNNHDNDDHYILSNIKWYNIVRHIK